MEKETSHKYKVKDKVFAKVRGYSPWPAIIDSVDTSTKLTKYGVTFYGTKDTALVKEIDMYPFMENKNRLGKTKVNGFSVAMEEANKSINLNSPKHITKSPLSGKNHDDSLLVTQNNTKSITTATSGINDSSPSINLRKELEKAEEKIKDLTERIEQFHKDPPADHYPDDSQRTLNKRLQTYIFSYKDQIRVLEKEKDTLRNEKKQLTDKLVELSEYCEKFADTNPNDKAQTDKEANNSWKKTQIALSILNKDWITDEPIEYYLEILRTKLPLYHLKMYFMNPTIVQALKCLNDTDYIFIDLNLSEQNYIVIPVNDSPAVDTPGGSGSHWSFLLYIKQQNQYFYFDSCGKHNYAHASTITTKLKKYLENNSDSPITIVPVPQQKNGYECGIYMLLYIDVVINSLLLGKSTEDWNSLIPSVTESDLLTKRSQLAMLYYNTQIRLNLGILNHVMMKPKVDCTIANQHRPTRIISRTRDDSNRTRKINQEKPQQQKTKSIKPQQKYTNRVTSPCKIDTAKLKLCLFADSHGRDVGYHLNNITSHDCRVYAHVQPGAPFEVVMEQTMNESRNFSKEDWAVIIAGCNNISNRSLNFKTQETFINRLDKTLQKLNNCNVLLSTIPFRHDLSSTHNCNQTIVEVNNKLRKIIRNHPHVRLLDLYLFERHHHTRHGLHLNKKGKQFLAQKIREHMLASLTNKQNARPPASEPQDKATLTEGSSTQRTPPTARDDNCSVPVAPGHLSYSEVLQLSGCLVPDVPNTETSASKCVTPTPGSNNSSQGGLTPPMMTPRDCLTPSKFMSSSGSPLLTPEATLSPQHLSHSTPQTPTVTTKSGPKVDNISKNIRFLD